MLGFAVLVSVSHSGAPPLPNARQLEFMEMETIQFMHFNVDTAWNPSDDFLRRDNPTYHNCFSTWTGSSNDSQTEGVWPCLSPKIFNPVKLDTEQWMESAAALGMKEVCLTAKHAGGFTLWPSNHTPYGVRGAIDWRGGVGDVLKEFVISAKKWNIKVCYYINPMTDGFLTQLQKVDEEEYMQRQKGMLTELLREGSPYGPVDRLWFDGVIGNDAYRPGYLLNNYSQYYDECFKLIRDMSPNTLISAYRGDVCATTGSLYTNSGPSANSTNSTECSAPSEEGEFFHPSEMHGVTMQEGPDGNTPIAPTYWFWHPWACAYNKTGCPWVGHSNASRIFDGYVATVGHGGVLNFNAAPAADGLLNASVVQVMHEAGKAINDTFKLNNAGASFTIPSHSCSTGVVVLQVAASEGKSEEFDFIVTMEDLRYGQRIGNYSIEYRLVGSDKWAMLVPPVVAGPPPPPVTAEQPHRVTDRPDGHDPRDQYIGHKRIDIPMVPTLGLNIAEVRFNCLRLITSVDADDADVYLRQFSLHKKIVPWEQKEI